MELHTRRGWIFAALLSAPVAAQPPRWGRFRDTELGPPQPKDDFEKRVLEVASRVPRRMNVPETDGRWLRLFAEAINAKHVVEIGTSTGYSGLWLALALKRTGGRLTTFEISAPVAETARKFFSEAGVADIITIVVGDAHEKVKELRGPVDMAFIDADKEGYRDYLEKLLPLVRPGGLILAHNVGSRAENPDYVDAVTSRPELETLILGPQMAVTLKKR